MARDSVSRFAREARAFSRDFVASDKLQEDRALGASKLALRMETKLVEGVRRRAESAELLSLREQDSEVFILR